MTGNENPVTLTIDGPVAVTATFVEDNVNTTPPVITLNGADPYTLMVGETYVEPRWTVTDNVDTDLDDDVIVTGTVDSNTVGTYLLEYSVTDSAGNVGAAARTVNVVEKADTTPPVITLAGADPLKLLQGTPYTEPGWTATDDVDDDLTGDVEVSGTVDVNTAGAYTLIYTVADIAGNTATVTRTVEVIPTLYLPQIRK